MSEPDAAADNGRQGSPNGASREPMADPAWTALDNYRVIIEQAPVGIYTIPVADRATQAAYMSPHMAHILGYAEGEATVSRQIWQQHIYGADRERVRAVFAQLQCGNVHAACEYRMRHRDGHLIWVHDEALLRTDEQGHPACIHGFCYAICPRSQVSSCDTILDRRVQQREQLLQLTMEALYDSEIRARLALKAGRTGIWEWNRLTDEIDLSDEAYLLLGLKPDAEPISFNRFLASVHPDDRPRFERELRTLRPNTISQYAVTRFVQPDATLIMVHGNAIAVAHTSSAQSYVIGTLHDVTTRSHFGGGSSGSSSLRHLRMAVMSSRIPTTSSRVETTVEGPPLSAFAAAEFVRIVPKIMPWIRRVRLIPSTKAAAFA